MRFSEFLLKIEFVGHKSILWGPWSSTSGAVTNGFQSQGMIILPVCFITCIQHIPQIYLWCNTYRPLGVQYGSPAISSTYLHTNIGGGQVQDQVCCCFKTDALLTELSWLNMQLRVYFDSWNMDCIQMDLMTPCHGVQM